MKKSILVIIIFMLFAGMVSAASINGEYNGKPIVKLNSNGQVLAVEDVPAVIMNGRTMVPISMLRQIGLGVEWNAEEYSVDVSLPTVQVHEDNIRILELGSYIEETKSILYDYGIALDLYTATIDESGLYLYAIYNVDNVTDEEELISNLSIISTTSYSLNFDELQGTIIETRSNQQITGTIGIDIESTRLYVNKGIDYSEFVKSWNVRNINNNATKLETDSILDTEEYSVYLCEIIDNKFNDLINKTKADYNRRGLFDSSMMQNDIKKLNEERANESVLNSCPK